VSKHDSSEYRAFVAGAKVFVAGFVFERLLRLCTVENLTRASNSVRRAVAPPSQLVQQEEEQYSEPPFPQQGPPPRMFAGTPKAPPPEESVLSKEVPLPGEPLMVPRGSGVFSGNVLDMLEVEKVVGDMRVKGSALKTTTEEDWRENF